MAKWIKRSMRRKLNRLLNDLDGLKLDIFSDSDGDINLRSEACDDITKIQDLICRLREKYTDDLLRCEETEG